MIFKTPIFSLPFTSIRAGRVFYGVMFAGLISVPILVMVFHRFIEPRTAVSTKEFYWIYSAIYISILFFCKGPTTKVTAILRKCLNEKSSSGVTFLAPAAANSSNPEIVALGRKYWLWALIGGYLTGTYFSWVGGIFFIFIF